MRTLKTPLWISIIFVFSLCKLFFPADGKDVFPVQPCGVQINADKNGTDISTCIRSQKTKIIEEAIGYYTQDNGKTWERIDLYPDKQVENDFRGTIPVASDKTSLNITLTAKDSQGNLFIELPSDSEHTIINGTVLFY